MEDQIEKKFKKGEISLDKAFELAKKIESKMSQDKNNQEREDKIQKEAWKIGPNVEKAAQQRQIGKSIRRNERKNALTFEDLEEAIEVLEDLHSKIQAQPKEKRTDLEAKFAKMKQKEGKTMFDRHQEMRKHMSKQEKGQEKTEERNEEALKKYLEAQAVRECLFIKDGRGDLIDDILHAVGQKGLADIMQSKPKATLGAGKVKKEKGKVKKEKGKC